MASHPDNPTSSDLTRLALRVSICRDWHNKTQSKAVPRFARGDTTPAAPRQRCGGRDKCPSDRTSAVVLWEREISWELSRFSTIDESCPCGDLCYVELTLSRLLCEAPITGYAVPTWRVGPDDNTSCLISYLSLYLISLLLFFRLLWLLLSTVLSILLLLLLLIMLLLL